MGTCRLTNPGRPDVTIARVTLLFGLELDDGVLLGSDSSMLLCDDDGAVVAQQAMKKIWSHPSNQDLVWGFTGDTGVGARFGDWLREQSPSAWDFLNDAGEWLATANGEGKRRTELASLPPDGFEAATVLIGGYLGPERTAKLALISSAGGVTPYEPRALAINGGATATAAAVAAWAAVWKLVPEADPSNAFVAALEATIAAIPGLDGPAQ
jgi:hypothetical protein